MTKDKLYKLIERHPIYMDGATGSNLQKAGMPTGVCPEAWILEHPQVLIDLQKAYVEAGTNILFAPTFGGNRLKLREYGLEDRIVEMNTKLVALSKEAAGEQAYVAGDITMTGESLAPMGNLDFEELVDVYKEQAKICEEAGVDLFVVETMMSLAETRAALIAIKEVSKLPVMISMTFGEDGRTLYGTDPVTAVVVLQSLGADVIGVNCSTGPDEMAKIIAQMKAFANVPLLAKPNAGLPKLVNGKTVYDMGPEEFASFGPLLVEAGASILGGCCGTTPEHIKGLVDRTKDMATIQPSMKRRRVLASERKTLEIDIDGPFLVIGERINPTGKKLLQASLREGSMDVVVEMAEAQEEKGADILDVNMGMNGIDEKSMMLRAIDEISLISNLPLCIDSSHVDVIEAALRRYPGKALINSISLEKEKFEKLLPLAKKYGAMFILLPLSDAGLPKSIHEKINIIHTIMERAFELGIHKEDIVVDGLVTTIGANKKAALETMETISYCKHELGLATVGGLSNISFGLPERANVNAAFVTMAIANGLTMAIANPSSDLMMNAAYASDLLLNKDHADLRYIDRMAKIKNDGHIVAAGADQNKKETLDPYHCVLKGNKNSIITVVKERLSQGKAPGEIINDELIPAINEVGKLYEAQKYFLPQLISSAETMKMAIEYLEPMLETGEEEEPKATVIMATVEGDIHDIGKNLVVLMLKNYGFRVYDLGKDVACDQIIAKAKELDADFIGLSALMTTTMMRMKDVVEAVTANELKAKVIIGGAVITQSFADEIGADGYSSDAADCVKLVQRLCQETGKK